MRGIALTALMAATIAPADWAAAQTVHWSAVVRVERWVSDGGSEFFGYWRSVFGNVRGPREFEYDGAPYTVRLFYITNEPRSLLVGLEKWGSTGNASLPADKGLAFMVDGVRFDLSDVTRSPGEGVVAWDGSGLDWTNGQLVSVELVEGATPVPTLPLAGTVLLGLLLGIGIWVRRGWSETLGSGVPGANTARRLPMGTMTVALTLAVVLSLVAATIAPADSAAAQTVHWSADPRGG